MRARRFGVAAAVAVVLLAALQLAALVAGQHAEEGHADFPALAGHGGVGPPGIAAYEGYGTWIDVYDHLPAYQPDGSPPPVTPRDLDAMAAAGVRTVYLQAAHAHARTPDPITDTALVGEFLVGAHERGMRVVAWYLPRFGDLARDLAHVRALADLEVDGHRFDGVALDIEWTGDVRDHRVRSERLVELSTRAREHVPDGAFGAIVMPPVQLEVVNPAFWPEFPWEELAPVYDAWLPMSYWTDRRADSGHRDGQRYTEDNIERLRANVGEDAVVHAIGGVGDETTLEELTGFAAALEPGGVIGASVYDWNSLDAAARAQLARDLGG